MSGSGIVGKPWTFRDDYRRSFHLYGRVVVEDTPGGPIVIDLSPPTTIPLATFTTPEPPPMLVDEEIVGWSTPRPPDPRPQPQTCGMPGFVIAASAALVAIGLVVWVAFRAAS